MKDKAFPCLAVRLERSTTRSLHALDLLTSVGTVCVVLFLLAAPKLSPQQPNAANDHEESTAISDVPIAEFSSELARTKPGPERDYVAGVLAAREGRDEEASQLFTQALPSLRRTAPTQAALLLRLLANIYDRDGLYARSEPVYRDLDHSGLLDKLPVSYRQGAQDDAELARVLASSPAQTLSWNGPVHLATSRRNPLGLITTKLTVNGVTSAWVLDTGANQSVVSRTFAAQLHLAPLPGVAHTSGGVTGAENPLRVAVLPNLPFGGATAHNVVLLVLDDASLTISDGNGHTYRISGIVGFPVLRALGRLTFHHDGTFDATAGGGSAGDGSPMELRLLNPVTEPAIEGQRLPFTLDTGASGTTLSVRFRNRFKAEEPTWKRSQTKNIGAGGESDAQTFLVPFLTFKFGPRSVTLQNLPVLPTVQHADIDALFGNIGEDVLQSVQSFTFDFVHMRFVMGMPLPRGVPAPAAKS